MSATDSRPGGADSRALTGRAPSADDYVGEEMSLFEHLDELRSRLFKSALAVAVGFAIGFVFRNQVLDVLRRPYCELPEALRSSTQLTGEGCNLLVLKALDPLFISIKAAAIVAVVLAAALMLMKSGSSALSTSRLQPSPVSWVEERRASGSSPVSYTHLTLPTIYSV